MMQDAQICGLGARKIQVHKCMCATYKNPHTDTNNVAKINLIQRIPRRIFKNWNPHGICKQRQYSISRKSKSQ